MLPTSLRLAKNLFLLDLKVGTKYKARLAFSFFQIFLMIFLFYYISKTLGNIPLLKGEYFPFVATGLAFQIFFSGIINSTTERIQEWRDYGLLEEMLFSHYSPWKVLIHANLYQKLFSLIKASLILLAAFFSLNSNWALNAGLFIATLTSVLVLATLLSMISSCSFLLWKRFSLLEIGASLFSLFLSGVYFPVSVLPTPLMHLAKINPALHLLTLLRKSLGIENANSLAFTTQESFVFLLLFTFATGFGTVLLYRHTIKTLKLRGAANHF